MHLRTKTLTIHTEETHRSDSRFRVKVERARITEVQQVLRANQGLPFYRGHVYRSGVQYSALND